MITIDSAEMTFHLKALNDDEYAAWTAALGSFHVTQEPGAETAKSQMAAQAAARAALPAQTLAELEAYERDVSARIGALSNAIAELRTLAATDDGSLSRYVGPLDQTFQTLDALFGQVSGWAFELRSVQESILMVPSGRPAGIEEDVFYDFELTDLSSSEDDEDDASEYADAEAFEADAASTATAVHRLPPSDVSRAEFQFRTSLPAPAPPCTVSLASILRKSIGKDSSGMVMPMGLNEPLSALQRLCEELEHGELLDRAAAEKDPLERLCLVAAFAVSAYASGRARADRKPFNPMLGETFEYVDGSRGMKFVAEKVSHRPLVLACHAQGPAWEWWQEQRVKTKFWGKSMEYIPSGSVNVRFADGMHLRWAKVVSCLRNVLGAKKWIEHYGEMVIEDVGGSTGLRATLSFKSAPGSFFGSGGPGGNEVTGVITDGQRTVRISGRWDDMLVREADGGRMEVLWRASPFPALYQEHYGFTLFALRLNQLLPGQADTLPPTDTRLRRDQRLLEEARVEEAEAVQLQLIERQRAARAEMEAAGTEWEPRWFKIDSPGTGCEGEWTFNGAYWAARERRDWSASPILW